MKSSPPGPALALACALLSGCAAAPRQEPAAPPPPAASAAAPPSFALGLEVQAYPTGVIPAVLAEVPLGSHDALTLRAGANVTDRGDAGEHEDEQGSGFGGGVGYRRYFGERLSGWLVGGRVDLWSLEIDWKDQPGAPAPTSGTSDILVLMPTVEAGYAFRLGDALRLSLTAALGAEINLDTQGEDVGEGAIGLLGVSLLYSF